MRVIGQVWRCGWLIFPLAGFGGLACGQEDSTALAAPAAMKDSVRDAANALRVRGERLLADLSTARVDSNQVWPEVRACLEQWESSTQLKQAGEQYRALLSAMMKALRTQAEFSFEVELRAFLERAAKISPTLGEGAVFKLGMAESFLRSPGTTDDKQRAATLLEEVLVALPERAPKDVAYALLCREILGIGTETPGSDPEALSLTETVRYLRALLSVAGVDPLLAGKARTALDALQKPDLRFGESVRYAPFEAIRFPFETRNLNALRYAVLPVAMPVDEGPVGIDRLSDLPMPLTPLIEDEIRYSDESSDWRTSFVEIGEGLAAGWYSVEVYGDGLSAREWLLITDIEVIVVPVSGGWEVRVFDLRDGRPLQGARVAFFREGGQIIDRRVSDEEGKALLEGPAAETAVEVAVMADGQPAALTLDHGLDATMPGLWQVVAHPRVVGPGQTLSWLVAGDWAPSLKAVFRLPDGQTMAIEAQQIGAGWASGEVVIPPALEQEGPLYFAQSDGTWTHVAHFQSRISPVVRVRPIGEEMFPGFAIYSQADFGGVEVLSLAELESRPDYVRVEVQPIQRQLTLSSKESLATLQRAPTVEVVNLSSGDPVLVPLRNLPIPEEWTAYAASVYRLGSRTPMGRVVFALTPERGMVSVSGTQRLVRLGEQLNLDIQRPWGGGEVTGSLAVYRETWQSRYLHRKRGTLISENDYLVLPERSLLGAAKTDYELYEEGFVREEVERLEVTLEGPRDTASLEFARPGYYKIEFEPESKELAVAYPEGSVEVWVLPLDGDVSAFRAERPRLILEVAGDGEAEVLLLMDRRQARVHLRWGDGETVQSRWLDAGEAAALFTTVPVNAQSKRFWFEAAMVGERFTGHLEAVLESGEGGSDWRLETDRRIGLRPGGPLQAFLHVTEKDIPLWWTFEEDLPFPESVFKFPPQAFLPRSTIRSLSRALPLRETALEEGGEAMPVGSLVANPRALLTLYPELKTAAIRYDGGPRILDQQSPYPMPRELNAVLPAQSGSWDLVIYGIEKGDLHEKRWSISTDLPIQATIRGPDRLRVGDIAQFDLELRNSLSKALYLNSQIRLPEGLELDRQIPLFLQVPAVRTVAFELSARVGRESEGALMIQLANEEVAVEAVHPVATSASAVVLPWAILTQEAGFSGDIPTRVEGAEAGSVILAPGIGSLVRPLWDLMRSRVRPGDDLLRAMGDWLLAMVESRHGVESTASGQESAMRLAQALTRHAATGGGWSHLPDGADSLWLSALIVASLELGASNLDTDLMAHLSQGREYLEKSLLSAAQLEGDRLLGLRTLSISAAGGGRGPTRLEARHFLDLFQKRDELSLPQQAMLLQTAKNFSFEEEVRLLSESLVSLLEAGDGASLLLLSERGLLYEVLKKDLSDDARASAVLARMLPDLSGESPVTGWEQYAAFMSLASDYYWRGDFDVEGSFAYAIGEDSLKRLPAGERVALTLLKKDASESRQMEETLRLDTSQLAVPLFVLIEAREVAQRDCPEWLNASTITSRHFEEPTLLRGPLSKIATLEAPDAVVGQLDLLYRRITLQGLQAGAPIELEVPLPGGVEALPETIEVELIQDGRVEQWRDWHFAMEDNGHCIRFHSTVPMRGDLRIRVGMRAEWAGLFDWPSARLYDRMAGTCHQVGPSLRLRIGPGEISGPGEG